MKVQGHGHAAPGTVVITPKELGETRTTGGILLPSAKTSYEALSYGVVVDCGSYVDRHGTVYGAGSGLTLWPLRVGSLVEYKHKPWEGKADSLQVLIVNSENVTRVWQPSEWKE
jgi:co-chaperonin GroES (HSP10)